MNYSQVTQKIAAYLNVEVTEIIRLEEWNNCYFVRVKGQRPTFVSKNILLPCIPLWSLYQLHQGFSWERNVNKSYIKERIEHHNNIVELCNWYGWSLFVDDYGWRIEGLHTTIYYRGLEAEIIQRLAEESTVIEFAIAA